MPKYEALFLLYDRAGEKYIQPGEVFEVTDPVKEKILLEKGLIKPASEKVIAQAGEVIQAASVDESGPKLKTK